MVKDICYRGFKIRKESPGKAIVYEINRGGLEDITIYGEDVIVKMMVDDGEIKNLLLTSIQKAVYMDELGEEVYDLLDNEILNEEMSDETKRINFKQARELYEEVKRLLDVDNTIKEYVPKLSSECEFTIYNILEIDEASDLEKLFEEPKK